jgi:hypothetical protein
MQMFMHTKVVFSHPKLMYKQIMFNISLLGHTILYTIYNPSQPHHP